MAAKNTISKTTPMHLGRKRKPKGLVREPAYSVKEICAMFNITHHRFAGLVSQHPLQAALNVGNVRYESGKGKAVYPLSAVKAWGAGLGLS